MREMQFSIEVNVPKQKVWNTLWEDKSLREWAGIIDPGTYMTGILEEGEEVQFISSENGYGVTSLVEKLIENEELVLRHKADTQDEGKRARDNQWTGSTESYRLIEKDGKTKLTIVFEVPDELETYFKETYPKAMSKIKELAERYE